MRASLRPRRGHARTERAARAEARKEGVARARICRAQPTHERIVAVHPPPDRNLAARRRGHARRLARLSLATGLVAAAGRFSHHPGDDAAAQDVQAAINASGSTLPRNLQYPPVYSKVNPADAPMVTLAITSDTISLRALSDIADTLLAQRLSELTGVGRVTVQGNIRPAIRVQADLSRLANYGISLEELRNVVVAANVAGAKGALDGAHQSYTIAANDQIAAAEA